MGINKLVDLVLVQFICMYAIKHENMGMDLVYYVLV